VLEERIIRDEERIQICEKELEVTILFGEEADRKYEEASIISVVQSTQFEYLSKSTSTCQKLYLSKNKKVAHLKVLLK
jgi:hypothetical protein